MEIPLTSKHGELLDQKSKSHAMEKNRQDKVSNEEHKSNDASLSAVKDDEVPDNSIEVNQSRAVSKPRSTEQEKGKRSSILVTTKMRTTMQRTSSKPSQHHMEKSASTDYSKLARPNEPRSEQTIERALLDMEQQDESLIESHALSDRERWQRQPEAIQDRPPRAFEVQLLQSQQERRALEKALERAYQVQKSNEIALKSSIRDKDAEIENLKSTIQKKDAQLAEQAHSTRQAQERVLEMIDTTQWSPEATAESKRSLDNIYDQCRSWSKRYAFSNLDEILPLLDERFPSRQAVLLRVCALEDKAVQDAICNKRFKKKCPALLLSAVLLDQIYRELFQNPFQPLDYVLGPLETQELPTKERPSSQLPQTGASVTQPKLSRQTISADLDAIGRMIGQNNPNNTHLWRAQTLRYLDPLASQLGRGITDGHKDSLIAQARRKRAVSFVEGFLAGGSGRLVARHDEPMKEQLLLIATQACEVAYRLWTQKTAIEIFSREGSGRTNYSRTMEELELHPYHMQDIDEDERALEGRKIILFVHPIVLARGSYEGNDYNRLQVWKKGMVWLG